MPPGSAPRPERRNDATPALPDPAARRRLPERDRLVAACVRERRDRTNAPTAGRPRRRRATRRAADRGPANRHAARPGHGRPDRLRLVGLRAADLLAGLQGQVQERQRQVPVDGRLRRRHLQRHQDRHQQVGCLPSVHRLAPVLRRRGPRRGDRHHEAQELGQGARVVQEARAVQRQAVLRPVGLGLHVGPLSNGQDLDGRQLGDPVRSASTTATS